MLKGKTYNRTMTKQSSYLTVDNICPYFLIVPNNFWDFSWESLVLKLLISFSNNWNDISLSELLNLPIIYDDSSAVLPICWTSNSWPIMHLN